MSLDSVNTVKPNKYYVHPKKNATNRIMATGTGLMATGLLSAYLLNERGLAKPSTPIEELPFKGKFDLKVILEECASGIKGIDKHLSTLKATYIKRFLPLGLAALSVLLGCYGLGSAMDNAMYSNRIKKAQKRSLELLQKEHAIEKNLEVKV